MRARPLFIVVTGLVLGLAALTVAFALANGALTTRASDRVGTFEALVPKAAVRGTTPGIKPTQVVTDPPATHIEGGSTPAGDGDRDD